MYKKFGKRVFDIIFSLVGVVLLFPLFIVVGLWIKLSSKGSIFFIQKRVGRDFKEFDLYKFRSMVTGAQSNGPGVTSKDDSRITNVGKFIRSTKIDELPQLFNVLKGDMSLVGPRPELKKFIDAKKKEYKKILSIKPGITDSASIEFRDEEKLMSQYKDKEKSYIDIILPKKIKLYYKYMDNISFINDVKLILQTLKVI